MRTHAPATLVQCSCDGNRAGGPGGPLGPWMPSPGTPGDLVLRVQGLGVGGEFRV